MKTQRIKGSLIVLLFTIGIYLLGTNSIDIKSNFSTSGNPKSSTELGISAAIEGNALSVIFQEDTGSAAVVVTTVAGTYVCGQSIAATPGNVQLNISNAGNYILTITLSNGDIYNANFSVQ